MMTQENPAYATVKAMSNAIITQKNRAYEDVTKIHKNITLPDCNASKVI